MANATAAAAGAIVPAQLGFLAIFNPCLGSANDTVDEQIVYYASLNTQHAGNNKRHLHGRLADAVSQEERNERLRQIGLAQGMINFSRGFADGASLDSVDTEKSRIIMHELEPDWWLLASINFTQIPIPPRLPVKTAQESEAKYEYSSRELKPASILLRDLLRAHSIFLLHHDTSLSALFVRRRRTKFVAVIGRYWDLFLSTWNVMLHGNPVRNILGGVNLAVSGELGVGVGEEQRGSGEREVLEGLVGRIEGLVDLVVSKFGDDVDIDDAKSYRNQQAGPPPPRWLGTGQEPAAEDGAIFLGVGALSRKSVSDVTHWMEDLYQWGHHAYGVIESPTSTRRARARAHGRRPNKQSVDEASSAAGIEDLGDRAKKLNEQVISEGKMEMKRDTEELQNSQKQQQQQQTPQTVQAEQDAEALTTAAAADASTVTEAPAPPDTTEAQDGKLDKMLSYMKLGYGSYWTIPGKSHLYTNPPSPTTTAAATSAATATPTVSFKPSQEAPPPRSPPQASTPPHVRSHPPQRTAFETQGHYLIGLKGSIEDDAGVYVSDSSASDSASSDPNNVRTVLRTVNIELEHKPSTRPDATIVHDFREFEPSGSVLTQAPVAEDMRPGCYHSHDLNKAEKLRVVVYVNRPFIFTFLFRLHTESLALDSLYRSLHHQLSPLKKPLLESTAYRPDVAAGTSSHGRSANNTMYSLVWDVASMTVHCTIPNIPESNSSDGNEAWSRADAINSHLHLLTLHALTRSKHSDLERHQKTTRGWWIVWTKLLDRAENRSDGSPRRRSSSSDGHTQEPSDAEMKNAIGDSQDGASGNESPSMEQQQQQQRAVVSKEIFLLRRASDHVGLGGLSGGGGSMVHGAERGNKLVQGIGVDTRRYVEDLLSFL
ncbi:hypothetical protein E4U40_004483 [Claviceps sp. LM458 group G5]|nr:hypothetical protein E4U40_004483 [Claviceps sp. LM458 group G5]